MFTLLLLLSLSGRNLVTDEDIAQAVNRSLQTVEACHGRAFKAAGVAQDGRSFVYRTGEPTVCGLPQKPTSYVRKSVKDTVWLCRGFLDEPEALWPVILIHEELHLYGVQDDHTDEQGLNLKIAKACKGAK